MGCLSELGWLILYGMMELFLDYFGLKFLDDLLVIDLVVLSDVEYLVLEIDFFLNVF